MRCYVEVVIEIASGYSSRVGIKPTYTLVLRKATTLILGERAHTIGYPA